MFHHVALAVINISQLLVPNSYCSQAWYEKGNGIRWVWRLAVSCDINKCCIESKVKKGCCATVRFRLSTICTYTHGMNLIESLILQAWGSLMTQTWSQYFQYFCFNKRMKIWMVLVLHQDSWRKRLHGTSTTGTESVNWSPHKYRVEGLFLESTYLVIW
jgi:hypothetical protein